MKHASLAILALMLVTPLSQAQTRVKPAAERSVRGSPQSAPAVRAGTGSHPERPALRGPRIPTELRPHLQKLLDARVERDFAQVRGLRDEAIALLTAFVAETQTDAREM